MLRKKSVDENGTKLLIDRLKPINSNLILRLVLRILNLYFRFYCARFELFFPGTVGKEQPSMSCSTFDAFLLSWAILLSLIDIRIHFESYERT